MVLLQIHHAKSLLGPIAGGKLYNEPSEMERFWTGSIGLDPSVYATHSMRRRKTMLMICSSEDRFFMFIVLYCDEHY
ncbi:hypothetical protein CPA50_01270 [Marinobacter sp. ANT_B65]|nr:hypothetical protein CPA50_01270 [Marinobacter sp. ANT_B65]